ncbi:MAG: HlyD family efflux transporter periplasmic adaptor subunit [Pirellulales bacterium]|nr:HlyD family efflux transporter periplasmic adaptor subunit [Pirellulales bacterium]
MKTRTWLVLLAIVAAVAVSVWMVMDWQSGVPVKSAVAQIKPIREFIVERGKTRLPQTYLITTPVTGRIKPITLDEGTPVQQGQIVAQMAPLDLKLDVDEAAAAVERLKAAIVENAETNVERTALAQAQQFVISMQETVKAAYERVAAGRAAYDYAEKNYGRLAPLAEKGVTTADELDQAELLKIKSAADFNQDRLVHSAMKALEAATNLLPTMIQQYIGNKTLSEAVLQKQLAEAAARQRRMVENQKRGVMTSPVDGVVLKRLKTNERYLPAGTVLLELGCLEALEIEADVLSLDVVSVKLDDPVEVFGPAIGEPSAKGTVKRIYPAGFTKISSLGVEQQRVKVIIRLKPEDLQRLLHDRHLEVGYRVHVRIITAAKPKALVIPRAALFRGTGNQWQVFAIRDGRAQVVTVQVGLLNDESAEVIDGLAEGDRVIVAPESSLSDGTRVKAEPPTGPQHDGKSS